MRMGDSEEPPQTPEEMDWVEEALGEDEVPVEADTGELGGCREEVAVSASALPGDLQQRLC